MGFPKKGMHFEQARSRLLKYSTAKSNPNVVTGLIEQAVAHEGNGAANELAAEFMNKRLGVKNATGNIRVGGQSRYSINYDAIFNKGSADS